MWTIYAMFAPYLGKRRRAKFSEILALEQAPKRNSPGATHCAKGHAYSGHNLIVRKDGKRRCRQCQRDWNRAKTAKRRAARESS